VAGDGFELGDDLGKGGLAEIPRRVVRDRVPDPAETRRKSRRERGPVVVRCPAEPPRVVGNITDGDVPCMPSAGPKRR
jgi:hypothetical protein